jgi:hypothetical protein
MNSPFLVELPLPMVLIIGVAIFVKLPSLSTGGTNRPEAKSFDIFGTGILAIALALLVVALNLAGGDVPFTAPVMIVLLATSPLFLALFAWYELKWPLVPLIPIDVLCTKEILPIMGTAFFLGMFSTGVSTVSLCKIIMVCFNV